MSSKNVALRDEALRILESAKKPGDSYSDAVVRLSQRRRSFDEVLETIRQRGEIGDDSFDRRLQAIRKHGNIPRKLRE